MGEAKAHPAGDRNAACPHCGHDLTEAQARARRCPLCRHKFIHPITRDVRDHSTLPRGSDDGAAR